MVKKITKMLPASALAVLVCGAAFTAAAQDDPKARDDGRRRSAIYNSLPSGYQQLGNTHLYWKKQTTIHTAKEVTGGTIDLLGEFNGKYYSSTYGDKGYWAAVKVSDNPAVWVDCVNGTTNNGVTVTADVEPYGGLARIVYSVTNTNSTAVTVSLGMQADVMIGNNDAAPLERRIDADGNVYGITMKHSTTAGDAAMCGIFGTPLAGVTIADDYWFGSWTNNDTPEQMVGDYNEHGNWMVENGSYDSGMGWCWKGRTIEPGATLNFAYLIGVGDVNFSYAEFDVTPTDLSVWNDLSRQHGFTVTGTFVSPMGYDGYLEFQADDETEWTRISTAMVSGNSFTRTFSTMFTPGRAAHELRFRSVDMAGNATPLGSREWTDVSSVTVNCDFADLTYNGLAQTYADLTADIEDGHWRTYYRNNVNAGTAQFVGEGVFPYTIGVVEYPFTILPMPLAGGLAVADAVYTGSPLTPAWSFGDSRFAALAASTDYTTTWADNVLPGTGTLTVAGRGNYTGTLTGEFNIDKATCDFDVEFPPVPTYYDGLGHGVVVTTPAGAGEVTVLYLMVGDETLTTDEPVDAGLYEVYVEIAEGDLYHGVDRTLVGTIVIERPSGIDEVSVSDAANAGDEWLSVQGTRVNAPTLPGIYIHNRKLVLVK